jgi:hypothetical protein
MRRRRGAYLCESCVFTVAVFLRLGAGMRHSMEKAVQFVQGTPRLAASQRTCRRQRTLAERRRAQQSLTLRAWQAAAC